MASPPGTPSTLSTQLATPATTPSPLIARGATAKSSARKIQNGASTPLSNGGGDVFDEDDAELEKCSREVLVELAKRRKREKDELHESFTDLEERESSLSNINAQLRKELQNAEVKMRSMFGDEQRMEEDLASRIEIAEKLRAQVRELEREKRDAERKYREQTDSFEHERQSWYDQERHFKLRISNLSTPKSTPRRLTRSAVEQRDEANGQSDTLNFRVGTSSESNRSVSPSPSGTTAVDEQVPTPTAAKAPSQPQIPPETLAELTELRSHFDSLSTSYDSLSSTLRTLQVELTDIKRVNINLMEQNESYEILLSEKTFSGELMGHGVFKNSWASDGLSIGDLQNPLEDVEEANEEDEGDYDDEESFSDAGNFEDDDEAVERVLLESQGMGSRNAGAVQAAPSAARPRKKKESPAPGPGLNLAAELDRAKEMEDEEEVERRQRKIRRKKSGHMKGGSGASEIGGDVDTLRMEVKTLRDANKALTLYVSKIIDRIIAMEGFEKVLAVDMGKSPVIPEPRENEEDLARRSSAGTVDGYGQNDGRPRLPSVMTGGVASRSSSGEAPLAPAQVPGSQPPPVPEKEKRSSVRMSIDWTSLKTAIVGAPKPKPPPAGLKPMLLGSSSNDQAGGQRTTSYSSTASTSSIRRIDTEEDEEDLRERARLQAELKLHGIEQPGSPGFKTAREAAAAAGTLGFSSMGEPSVRSSGRSSSTSHSRPGSFRSSSSGDAMISSPPQPADIIKSVEIREKEQKGELLNGRASGFTEVSRSGSTRRRSSGRSSAGLGIGLGVPGGSGMDRDLSDHSDGGSEGRRSVLSRIDSEGITPTRASLSKGPSPSPSDSDLADEGSINFRAAKRSSRAWSGIPINVEPS